MAKPLTDFFVKLLSDPKAMAEYKRSPRAAIKAAGLSPGHENVLLSKDRRKIGEAIEDEHGGAGSLAAFIFAFGTS